MTAATPEEAQVSLDRFLAGPGDARTRPIAVAVPETDSSAAVRADLHSQPGIRVRATVGELADPEPLLVLPALAIPATIEVTRPVGANAPSTPRQPSVCDRPLPGTPPLTIPNHTPGWA
jgi:hypothetical protein